MIKLNKAISPIVSSALLILVAVIGVIGFQNWFGMYSNDMFVKTEKDSSQTSQTNIETLIGKQLYFKNTLNENITIQQIKLGNRECNISLNISPGVHNISLGNCVDDLTLDSNIGDITIISNKQIYTKKHLFKDAQINNHIPTILNFVNVDYNFAPNGTFYGASSVLINVSANQTIENCSLNFNGTINTTFTIQNDSCWIVQPLMNFGNYIYNVTVIANNSAKNLTINKNLDYIEMYQSCKQILDAGKSIGDGNYTIDIDGINGNSSFLVYCDMTNGGWSIEMSCYNITHSNHNLNYFTLGSNLWCTSDYYAKAVGEGVPYVPSPDSYLSNGGWILDNTGSGTILIAAYNKGSNAFSAPEASGCDYTHGAMLTSGANDCGAGTYGPSVTSTGTFLCGTCNHGSGAAKVLLYFRDQGTIENPIFYFK